MGIFNMGFLADLNSLGRLPLDSEKKNLGHSLKYAPPGVSLLGEIGDEKLFN